MISKDTVPFTSEFTAATINGGRKQEMNIQLTTADLQGKEGLLTEAIQEKLMNCITRRRQNHFSAGRYPDGCALFKK